MAYHCISKLLFDTLLWAIVYAIPFNYVFKVQQSERNFFLLKELLLVNWLFDTLGMTMLLVE
jgi:hypothetical protein